MELYTPRPILREFCAADFDAVHAYESYTETLSDTCLRETRWWNGAWADEFVYSILEGEWGGSGW